MQEERASGGKTWGDAPAWIDEMIRAGDRAAAELDRDPTALGLVADANRAHLASTLASHERHRPRYRALARCGRDARSQGGARGSARRRGRYLRIDRLAMLSRFLGAVASAATAEGVEEVRLMQADSEVTSDRW